MNGNTPKKTGGGTKTDTAKQARAKELERLNNGVLRIKQIDSLTCELGHTSRMHGKIKGCIAEELRQLEKYAYEVSSQGNTILSDAIKLRVERIRQVASLNCDLDDEVLASLGRAGDNAAHLREAIAKDTTGLNTHS